MEETKKTFPSFGGGVDVVQSPIKSARDSLTESGLLLSEIKTGKAAFRLNQPVSVSFFFEDDLWYCESRELSILSFGKSKKEALESFCEDFSTMWEVIAQSADESLTPSAQSVKRAMLHAVDLVSVE